MKILILCILIALAMGSEEECSEERAEACVDTLLSALLDDVTTEEDVCRELRTSVDCLKNTVDDCLADDSDEEIKEGLKELEKLLAENCEKSGDDGDDDDEEMGKCFQENEDYVYECIYEGSTQALSLLMEKDNIDENALQCLMYGMMTECFVDRIREKCGNEAGELAEKELSDLPSEIQQACEASTDVVAYNLQLLEDRKKK